jgi:hypothetical protein
MPLLTYDMHLLPTPGPRTWPCRYKEIANKEDDYATKERRYLARRIPLALSQLVVGKAEIQVG